MFVLLVAVVVVLVSFLRLLLFFFYITWNGEWVWVLNVLIVYIVCAVVVLFTYKYRETVLLFCCCCSFFFFKKKKGECMHVIANKSEFLVRESTLNETVNKQTVFFWSYNKRNLFCYYNSVLVFFFILLLY